MISIAFVDYKGKSSMHLCLVIPLLAAFHEANIPATIVGKLLPQGAGEWLLTENGRQPLPEFAVDEITKLF